MSQNQIRLDELTGRALDIRWFEGVALVQAVCRQVVSGGAPGFPLAREIALTAAGTVSVGGGRSSGNPVQAAAHILASMLGDDVPVRLRLVVTQATSPGEVYPTLADFSEAIAYFERPDASQVLANLFERAASAPQRAGDAVRGGEPPVAAEPEREDERPAGPRRRSRLAALAPVAGVAIVAAIWAAGSEQGTASLAGAATAVTTALERGWAAVGAQPAAEPVEKAT
ncbi:MAG TPA: hypothetical protein VD833_10630, partial [Vicinamibacterales bacterium]|nr:hypothetical protein [Vicinamibacterales bacterium]